MRGSCLAFAFISHGLEHRWCGVVLAQTTVTSRSPCSSYCKSVLLTQSRHFPSCHGYMQSPASFGLRAQSCSPHLPRYVLQLLHAQSGSYEAPILSYSYTLQFLQSDFLHIFSCLLWPSRVTNHLGSVCSFIGRSM